MGAPGERADVVVVGGGAAGCVVAARLAETPSRSVLLLEAGPDLRANVPDELRDGWNLSREFDWGYESQPDERGVVENVRRGKLLGGTSLVTRFAVRGSPADFDEWAALGNEGWGFDDVLPYFNRLESDAEFGDQPWHGASGPIPVTRYPELELTEVASAAREELLALGFPEVEDHNRPGAVGVGRMPMSSRDGIRVTTADAYLPGGGTPPNLTVRADTHVAEVVFDGGRATGVRTPDGALVEAGRVVICAGTYGSPAMLMRSGIGPADHLGSVGVPVRVDLSGVGGNLADHPAVDVDPGYRGPGRTAPVLHTIATFHSSAAATDGPPDLMLWVADPSGEYSIDVVLLKPEARGTVRLSSADPAAPLLIELPALREPADLDRLAEGFRRGWELTGRPELRRLCAEAPSPELQSGEDLRGAVRENAYSIPHTVGTCAMGPSPDDGAVVDASGSVHGTEGLSVVDASIMPVVPSGFPHVVTIMLAERLSEAIAAQP
jgi:choline dehydrogenase-like flavoprotein